MICFIMLAIMVVVAIRLIWSSDTCVRALLGGGPRGATARVRGGGYGRE